MFEHAAGWASTLRLRRRPDRSVFMADRRSRKNVARRDSVFNENAKPQLGPLFQLKHMRKKECWFRVFVFSALLSAGIAESQVEFVDPSMGGQGFMLEPTRPTVSLPNSMIRVYPVRKDQLDDQIHSFPLTIISHRLGELFWLMPGAGSSGAWDQPQAYDQEVETPYYYSTRFDNSLIQTEFTPTERSGYFRFTFPNGRGVIALANRRGGNISACGSNCISG